MKPSSTLEMDVLPTETLKSYRNQAFRYWEPRRILYLLLLAGVTGLSYLQVSVTGSFGVAGPIQAVGALVGWVVCFIGANLSYCAVYWLEFAMLGSRMLKVYRKLRVGVFILGCLFAGGVTYACSQLLFWGMRV